jgi:hypothetical protein
VIYVLTCSRGDGFDYLEQLLDRWEENLPPPTVVCDVSQRSAEEQVADETFLRSLVPMVVPYRRPEGTLGGNKLAYWHCLELAAAAGADALILEDDVEPCTNALRRMSIFEIPRDLGFVTFFAPVVFQGGKQYPGLWRTPTPLHGTQAIKFSRATLRALVDWGSTPESLAHSASDMAIANATIRLGIKHGAHCPELVQHTGDLSSVSPSLKLADRFRTSLTFPGRKFDALSLYAVNKAFL